MTISLITIGVIAALAIIALLGLAWLAYATAEVARTSGYDQGYGDAKTAFTEYTTSLEEQLTSSVGRLAKHPMREAQQAIAKLHSALAGLVGESTPQGLSQLEVGLKLVPMPATEKALMSAAIQALRDTAGLITATEVQP